ncbi:DUF4327 family protein [Waterburya agarophytonicola K14]|uniref:DUF4327 family protein n=1 Tax=Waterburya agarophytonicola KI4 TaxID=2874699 RepID=A0A964BQC1_9CYAN|nr:DUF4327 family protein [Waterburya agarophytonicola]MCC0177648.1 DUF4327 family protein [Waterburya agarophytonicola KI4]
MISTQSIQRYSISTIREEALNLLEIGLISLDQPLRILYEYLPAQYWNVIEGELERHDYLLRDRIIDLVGALYWNND